MAKEFYIGVGGVARKVKQPYIGVNSVARKVKKGYIGVNGVARQFFSGGTPISSLAVGSTLYLNENGSSIPYLVAHHGKPSSIYDDSCNGTWLLRTDIVQDYVWSSDNENGIAYSSVFSWLNSTMLSKYDSNIQNTIKQVKIPYMTYGKGSLKTGANGYSCKVFLLSGYEVGGYYDASKYIYLPQDGAKLDYFISGNNETTANNRRKAWATGETHGHYNHPWWLRSPSTDNTYYQFSLGGDGQIDSGNAINLFGLRPALIMPSDTLIDTSTNTIIT